MMKSSSRNLIELESISARRRRIALDEHRSRRWGGETIAQHLAAVARARPWQPWSVAAPTMLRAKVDVWLAMTYSSSSIPLQLS
jgi:hypothetical protein